MHGLYLAWWVQERHIPAATVAAMLAAGELAISVFEIPTGWFADRVGHRASLIVGSFVQVIGMLFCWLGQGVPALLAASILVALGDAFRSGADQALLYRTCVALDREERFLPIESRTRAIAVASLVLQVLAGGLIVGRWGFGAGWLVETCLCALGLAVAIAMVEPPRVNEAPGDLNEPTCGGRLPMRAFAAVILPAAVLGAAEGIASFVVQTNGQFAPSTLTVLVAGIALAEAAGSALTARFQAGGVLAQVALGGLGLTAFSVALGHEAALPAVTLALSFLLGFAHPLRALAIQRLATDDVRARAASLASACDKVLSTITLPLAGWWPRRR